MSNEINTFLSEDLEKILIVTGELEAINNGERCCNYCKNIVSPKNIQIIYKEQKRYCYVCNEANCLSNYNLQTER